MSAVPLPALVLAGTSDLPSSVALNLSAKAGPENATAAAKASVAYMVLVMVVSLPVDISDGAKFTTKRSRLYSRNRPLRRNIFCHPMAGAVQRLIIRYGA